MNQSITILQLYPRDMNIYGDYGNTLTLKRRLEWCGFTPRVIDYNLGDSFPAHVDIIIGGGGQDSGQNKIQADLLSIGPTLKTLADTGVPMLMVCGLYQLFGHGFVTADGTQLVGIGVLDVTTYAKPQRLIGNVVTKSHRFGEIIGYENHSGQTFLGTHAKPLARVVVGDGNNTDDEFEGAYYKNVIGTYLHGSLLPKNPLIADFLIRQAVINKYGTFEPEFTPDDHFTRLARQVAMKRPR